eukprot:3193026-Amphidinium_carterae.2
MLTKLQKALKLRPSMILPCWEKVLALGYVEDDAAGAESSGVPVSKQKQAKLQRGASMKGDVEENCGDISDPMSKNWTLLSHCTIPFIQAHILPSLEPSALSAANLRCHEKHIGKPELLQIVEFLTGLADWQLSGPHRSKSGFIKFLQERYASRGRRGGLLVLPVAWAQQGLYVIDAVTDVEITVRSQYTETEIPLQSYFAATDFITPEKQKVKTGMASPSIDGISGSTDTACERGATKKEDPLHADRQVEMKEEELKTLLTKLEGQELASERGDKFEDEGLLAVPPPPLSE